MGESIFGATTDQTSGRSMTISDEIEAFIRQHRGGGQLVGDAIEPLPNGYQLTITCPCDVMFVRWVTPEDAAIDFAALARPN